MSLDYPILTKETEFSFISAGKVIMRSLIQRVMYQSDDLVIVFDYVDSKGNASRRVVSPIRFVGDDRFLGLCLSREEPRQFYLSRCKNVRIGMAANFVMPVPIMSLPTATPSAVAV